MEVLVTALIDKVDKLNAQFHNQINSTINSSTLEVKLDKLTEMSINREKIAVLERKIRMLESKAEKIEIPRLPTRNLNQKSLQDHGRHHGSMSLTNQIGNNKCQ